VVERYDRVVFHIQHVLKSVPAYARIRNFLRKGSRMKLLFPHILLALLLSASCAPAVNYPALGERDLAWVGERIFANECAGRLDCLTAWNDGEDFPSLGIGHFIWYRQGQEAAFTESFPDLLRFLEARGTALPAWISAAGYASPWASRADFEADTARRAELRALLEATMADQAAFIVQRFESALARILEAAPPSGRAALEARFLAVANAHPPHGLYALIDYVNFKGEGIAESERYRGEGWGLRQVLEGMGDGDPLGEFAAAAREVLARRVDNAPAERGEQRWLAGWHKRVDTYLPPAP